MWQDEEGEGYWADLEKVRLVVKADPMGLWEKWLLVPSSGGAVYRACEKSLLRAKEDLRAFATEFVKDVYNIEFVESVSLVWHPIGPGGRFVLLLVDSKVLVEECNPEGEVNCALAHNGALISIHDNRVGADARARLAEFHPTSEN
jgi:hypothetical protein